MSLRDRLGERLVMMEVIPPGRRASEGYVRRFVDSYVSKAVRECEPDAINIPEIVDENYRGAPFYRNMDPRDFSEALRSALKDEELVVNKVAVHCNSGPKELKEWASTTIEDYGIENAVAVGGSSSSYSYPGPTVLEANRILRETGLCCGNIMIPERREEPRRMLEKTSAGAEFFTTQAIFSSVSLLDVIREYDALCKARGIEPAAIFVSFTPVSDRDDIEFLRWLGVNIGQDTERELVAGGQSRLAESSVELAVANWQRIRAEKGSYGGIPVGLNLEYISRHNLDNAVEMGRRLIEVV